MKKNSIIARNILLLNKLNKIIEKSYSQNIKLVLLKGAALLTEEIFKISDREMSDIDILVKKSDERKFESLLRDMGFSPMKNSSDSFILNIGEFTPPIIVDLHYDLYHINDINEFWKNSIKNSKKNTKAFILKNEETLLHLIMHPFLHHGFLSQKNKNDLSVFLRHIKPKKDFWLKTSELSKERRLKPFIYPALKEINKEYLIEKTIFDIFRPHISESFYSPLIKIAVKKHINFVEYLLPAIYNPKIAVKKIFPSDNFLLRRYSRTGFWIKLARPFKILKNIIFRNE